MQLDHFDKWEAKRHAEKQIDEISSQDLGY